MEYSNKGLDLATKLFNTIKAGVVIIDPYTRTIIDANNEALIMMGKNRQALIQHSCKECFCNGCADKCSLLEKCASGEIDIDDFESHLIRADGSKLIIIKTLSTILCDGKKYIVESFIDITDIRDAELKAQTYLNVAPALFVALDTNGNITMINRFGMDLLECDDSILGNNWFDTFISDIDRPDMEKIFKELVTGKRLFSVCENEVFTIEGNKRVLSWRNAVLKNINNEVIAVIAAGNDITDQRIAENELEKHWASEEERLEYTLRNFSILSQTA